MSATSGSTVPPAGQLDDRVVAGVVGEHLAAQRLVGRRVLVGREGHRDDRRAQPLGHPQRGAQQADGGEGGGAATDQRQQHHVAETGELLGLPVGERVGDRDERAAGVPTADVGRREVEPAERAVLGVGEWRDRPAGSAVGAAGDGGEGEALGVDQLDRPAGGDRRGQVVGQGQRDRAARLVEAGRGCERPDGEQLQVVQLARRRVVLGQGRWRHGGYPAKSKQATRKCRAPVNRLTRRVLATC
ncbi:hypothetical protein [Nocardioides sp. TF02-7]|uniref:hypothetical protein n=1 Tax=Nocardioides sp. TF02-7 TaxID=2917724 RepID=UPI001F070727|nr:hypothetical protein [Nocardioides sp. TF02-7]UMG91160.1 hypothetical protein MF408_13235 [Nocardioides sp. TF02-7]